MGFVVGGFGGGALVFNFIQVTCNQLRPSTLFVQTAILNPANVSPAESGVDKGYFTDVELLSRWVSLPFLDPGSSNITPTAGCPTCS